MNDLPHPVKLELAGENRLTIAWSDGERRSYTFRELREACPCASCREKRKGTAEAADSLKLPVLSAAETQPLRINGMKPVGNYAYTIAFSDGHDTGIYTFDLLLELGEPINDQ